MKTHTINTITADSNASTVNNAASTATTTGMLALGVAFKINQI